MIGRHVKWMHLRLATLPKEKAVKGRNEKKKERQPSGCPKTSPAAMQRYCVTCDWMRHSQRHICSSLGRVIHLRLSRSLLNISASVPPLWISTPSTPRHVSSRIQGHSRLQKRLYCGYAGCEPRKRDTCTTAIIEVDRPQRAISVSMRASGWRDIHPQCHKHYGQLKE